MMLTREGDRLKIVGQVNVESVRGLLEQGSPQLADVKIIDMADVTEVDSSAVSLILEWQREAARRNNGGVRFENLPQNIRSLADLYGVADLIHQ